MSEISVTNIRRETRAEHIRVVADVSYGNKFLANETYWIEVHERFADDVSLSGNPWLLILLPLALTLRSSLRIDAPVDPTLYENIQSAMNLLAQWFPSVEPVKITAPLAVNPRLPTQTATLFTLGVDSFYTLFTEDERIDDLITIRHIPTEYQGHMQDAVVDVGHQLHKKIIFLETNIRQTNWRLVNWTHLGFVPFFTGCAMVLENRYQQLFIPSLGFREAIQHIDHPEFNRLLSTSQTAIGQHGTGMSRSAKLEVCAANPLFRQYLKVCWQVPAGNCGICEKCYRTKIGLELLGLRETMAIFEDERFSIEGIKARQIKVINSEYYRDLLSVAYAKERHDLAEAIEYLLANTVSARKISTLLKNPQYQAWFRQRPLLWNLFRPIVFRLFGQSIHNIHGPAPKS